jgi:hypothetical protein
MKSGWTRSELGEPRRQIELGVDVGREALAEGFGWVDIFGVAEEVAPGGGDPVAVFNEIEFEGAERTRGASEVLEASIVGETGFFEFVALGDVEAEAGHAFEFAVRTNLLEAGALKPYIVPQAVAHAELDLNVACAGCMTVAEEVRCGV